MGHSYTNSLYHCVFSTKERQPLITSKIQERLWPFLGGVARQHRMRALAVGGIADHVHLLLSLPSTLALSKAMQLIKGESSKWIDCTFPDSPVFSWQEGYGAFTIGVSQVDATVTYIRRQAEHHRRRTFQEEFIEFLERHGIEYDPRYVRG